jgi:hypothetical protein
MLGVRIPWAQRGLQIRNGLLVSGSFRRILNDPLAGMISTASSCISQPSAQLKTCSSIPMGPLQFVQSELAIFVKEFRNLLRRRVDLFSG